MRHSDTSAITRLIGIMARLRDPDHGCPWDLAQSFATIAPHTIEEAYEVADAIERGDLDELKDELGDLLFQVVFYARMAEEQRAFAFGDVVNAIADKMLKRHPHVFGDTEIPTAEAQTGSWEALKAEERAAKSGGSGNGVLDGIAQTLPAMTRAVKLQKRAARVGFDWPELDDVLAKLEEEVTELQAAKAASEGRDRLEDEVGDILFVCTNIARHLGIDPETALRRTNRKFERRFRAMETALQAENRDIGEADLAELERLWQSAKRAASE